MKIRITTENTKRISAVLLLISFFLPLSKCSSIEIPTGDEIKKQANIKKTRTKWIEIKVKYHYAYDQLDLSRPGTLFIILSYIWPVLVLLYHYYGSNRRLKKVLNYIELFLCIASFNLIILLALFDELFIGAYLAMLAISLYFFSTFYEFIKEIQMSFRNRED